MKGDASLESFFALECQQHASWNNELSWNENKIAKQTAITAKHVDTREQRKGRPVRGHEQTHQHKSFVLIFLSSHKSSADLSIFISHYEPTFPSRGAGDSVGAGLIDECLCAYRMDVLGSRVCASTRFFRVKLLTVVDYDEESENFPQKISPELFCPEKCGSGVHPGAGGVWHDVMLPSFIANSAFHFSRFFIFENPFTGIT